MQNIIDRKYCGVTVYIPLDLRRYPRYRNHSDHPIIRFPRVLCVNWAWGSLSSRQTPISAAENAVTDLSRASGTQIKSLQGSSSERDRSRCTARGPTKRRRSVEFEPSFHFPLWRSYQRRMACYPGQPGALQQPLGEHGAPGHGVAAAMDLHEGESVHSLATRSTRAWHPRPCQICHRVWKGCLPFLLLLYRDTMAGGRIWGGLSWISWVNFPRVSSGKIIA